MMETSLRYRSKTRDVNDDGRIMILSPDAPRQRGGGDFGEGIFIAQPSANISEDSGVDLGGFVREQAVA